MLHPVGQRVTLILLFLLFTFFLKDLFGNTIPKTGFQGAVVQHDKATLLPLLHGASGIDHNRGTKPVLTCCHPLFEKFPNELSILVRMQGWDLFTYIEDWLVTKRSMQVSPTEKHMHFCVGKVYQQKPRSAKILCRRPFALSKTVCGHRLPKSGTGQ